MSRAMFVAEMTECFHGKGTVSSMRGPDTSEQIRKYKAWPPTSHHMKIKSTWIRNPRVRTKIIKSLEGNRAKNLHSLAEAMLS